MKSISQDQIYKALGFVEDPELEIDVLNLGLIYEVKIEGATVIVRMTLTTLGCPASELLELMTKKAVGSVEGVEEVKVEWTFDPPWTPERITEEGRDMLLSRGFI